MRSCGYAVIKHLLVHLTSHIICDLDIKLKLSSSYIQFIRSRMKSLTLLLSLLLLPTLASAEIYKWKESDGVIRYSDVPPPSNIKQEAISGKKSPKPTGTAPMTEVADDLAITANKDKLGSVKDKAPLDKKNSPIAKAIAEKSPLTPPGLSKEEAASKRAKDAEQQKKADEAKLAELNVKQANCKSAKSNLATYTTGGRISRTNEKGEREFMSDDDIGKAKADSQKDVEKYCD